LKKNPSEAYRAIHQFEYDSDNKLNLKKIKSGKTWKTDSWMWRKVM